MAEEAFRNDLTSKLTFSVTVWALLLATLISPLAFRRSLGAHHLGGDYSVTRSGGADKESRDEEVMEMLRLELKSAEEQEEEEEEKQEEQEQK